MLCSRCMQANNNSGFPKQYKYEVHRSILSLVFAHLHSTGSTESGSGRRVLCGHFWVLRVPRCICLDPGDLLGSVVTCSLQRVTLSVLADYAFWDAFRWIASKDPLLSYWLCVHYNVILPSSDFYNIDFYYALTDTFLQILRFFLVPRLRVHYNTIHWSSTQSKTKIHLPGLFGTLLVLVTRSQVLLFTSPISQSCSDSLSTSSVPLILVGSCDLFRVPVQLVQV